MGPRSNRIIIIVSTVRADYVSNISNIGEGNDDTGCGVVCPRWRLGEQAGMKPESSRMQVVIRTQ